MLNSYKFRIYPNNEQIILLNKTFGCVRFIYNKILGKCILSYEETGRTEWTTPAMYKTEFPWLKEVDSLALCNAQLNVKVAYKNFFSGMNDRPVFKSKKNHNDSYTTNNVNESIRIFERNKIRLPKIGNMKIKIHREVIGKIKSVTISRKPSGKYYISILTEYDDIDLSLPKTNQNVGIDLGIHTFATLSNGMKFENLRLIENNLDKLIKLQQNLSRKQRDSKNRAKARIKLAKLYERINNQKQDYLHKLSKMIVTNYDKIAIENLDISSMIVDNLDSRIAEHNINRSLLSMNFREFRTMLEYKCKKYGKELIIVDRYFPSSQKCSHCGEINSEIRNLNIREWTCPHCNTTHDRDINAARNLLLQI